MNTETIKFIRILLGLKTMSVRQSMFAAVAIAFCLCSCAWSNGDELKFISPATQTIRLQKKAKFEPDKGNVIVFVGQDNSSVGGNAHYKDGYVDNIGVPGGISHYVGIGIDKSNKFAQSMSGKHVNGLYTETSWGAGPMCLKYYVDSPILKKCIIHLSIAMTDNNEDKVADGSHDHLIDELSDFLRRNADTPFLLRIGYEFDGQWNNYDPNNFKKAFCRIVDKLHAAELSNFATVMASSSSETAYELWQIYYPGDDYVDWVGYSYWGGNSTEGGALRFARDKAKPVFIAESTPRGHYLDKEDGCKLWDDWFETYFKHINENIDVIRAISYINCHWEEQPMWKGQAWGNTRIELNQHIKQKWLRKMGDSRFINADDNPFKIISFNPRADVKNN